MIIELTGLPKAGKTSVTNRLANRLRQHGLSVKKIQDESGKNPISPHEVFSRETWLAHRLIDRLHDPANKKFDIVLINRGLAERIMMFTSLYKYKLLDLRRAKLASEYLKEFLPYEDLVFYLDVTPKVSLQRNKGKKGRLINNKFLTLLRRAYHNQFPKVVDHYFSIDATMPLNEVVDEIAEIVVSLGKKR